MERREDLVGLANEGIIYLQRQINKSYEDISRTKYEGLRLWDRGWIIDSRDTLHPSKASRGVARSRNPSRPSNAWSRLRSGLGVVSSRSPMKIELAPARKQSACASSESESLPALNLTIEAGIRMRAVAIILTSSKGSVSGCSASGVPATRTNRLIGTLSGCGRWLASCSSRP